MSLLGQSSEEVDVPYPSFSLFLSPGCRRLPLGSWDGRATKWEEVGSLNDHMRKATCQLGSFTLESEKQTSVELGHLDCLFNDCHHPD